MQRLWLLLAPLGLLIPALATAQLARPGTAGVIAGLQQEDVIALGERAYQRYCSGCHGVDGNGQGPAARWLDPKPRDFTAATFKFRTTPSGTLPTDADLYRTITEGVHGTSMHGWRLVSETERLALVQYIKTFSNAWEDESLFGRPMSIPTPPEDMKSDARVRAGRTIYRAMNCHSCHGDAGAGDGPSAPELKDDLGHPIAPANFQRGVLRGGRTYADIYRAIVTGYSGTPMPSFNSLKEEQVWDVVAYLRYVMKHQADPKNDEVDDPCTVWGTCAPAAPEAPTEDN